MTRIKFEYPAGAPTTTVELSSGLEMRAPSWKAEIGTVTSKAFSGKIFAYEKGPVNHKIPLKIDLLNVADRNSLIDFVENTVEGSFRVFRYTDQDGETHDVRFLNEDFDYGDGTFPYSLSVTLLEV